MKSKLMIMIVALGISGLLFPNAVQAHCDGLDGPVVEAARKALARKDVNLVLIWVLPEAEPEIISAFNQALAVRSLGKEARELADRYFFETLVRVHRSGEGAPYTGLKPAGRDLGPAIPTADKAVATGNPKPALKLLNETIKTSLHARFQAVMATRDYNPDDVEAGREFVEAYVKFLHFVEPLYQQATVEQGGHGFEHNNH